MVQAPLSADRLHNYILTAIKSEIEAVAEEELAAAQKRIETRIRQKLGALCMSMLSEFDVQRNKDRILITVRDQRQS